MSVKFTSQLFFFLMLLLVLPARAAGIDDIDQRLFQVQQSMAKKGDVRAQYYLGEMYEQGLGTEQNVDEAFKWYKKAAARGDALSKRKLAHRAEIEADIRSEKAAESIKPVENIKPAPEPKIPKTTAPKAASVKKLQPPPVTAQADKASQEEDKLKAALKAAEKEKRRAIVRAMILDSQQHPVGEPFQ
ncbi:MAG: tetratricopeptide repeat protein [Sulfuricaulis sp.]